MIWQFVKHFACIVMFALSTTYTYWTLADAQVKKDEHLENQNLRPFSPIAHWDFLPKFLSLHYYTTLEGVLGVQRCRQAQGTIIYLFGPLFFSKNGLTLKKAKKIIKIH